MPEVLRDINARIARWWAGHPSVRDTIPNGEIADRVSCAQHGIRIKSEDVRKWKEEHNIVQKSEPKATTPTIDEGDDCGGLEGFRRLHSLEEIQKRRDERTLRLIREFIDGPLEKRGWYYDMEACRIAGVATSDWARYRDSFAHLQVMVRTDFARDKKLAWCHPSCVEEMRTIAERG